MIDSFMIHIFIHVGDAIGPPDFSEIEDPRFQVVKFDIWVHSWIKSRLTRFWLPCIFNNLHFDLRFGLFRTIGRAYFIRRIAFDTVRISSFLDCMEAE